MYNLIVLNAQYHQINILLTNSLFNARRRRLIDTNQSINLSIQLNSSTARQYR